MCLEYLKDELIVNKRISKEAIVKERYELCVCKVKMHHNTMTLHVMPCCSAIFSDACLTEFFTTYTWCPFCGTENKANNRLLSTNDDLLTNDDVLPEIVSNNVNNQEEVRENDAMRKESAKKKR